MVGACANEEDDQESSATLVDSDNDDDTIALDDDDDDFGDFSDDDSYRDDDDSYQDDDDDDNDDAPDTYCSKPEADCTLAEAADEVGFYAGVAVSANLPQDREDLVLEHFNSITSENALKWGSLTNGLGNYDFTQADALIDWAQDMGLRIRGHVLVWGKMPGHGHPSDLQQLIDQAEDPAAFTLDAIRTHIATTAGRYAGRIDSWDVVNEPLALAGGGFERNIFYNATGTEYIAEAFHAARLAAPNAKLFLNEYFYFYDGPRANAFLALLDQLLDAGVPIDGVGIQGHVYLPLPHLEPLKNFLARIADRGLEIEFTEADVAKIAIIGRILDGADVYELQAEIYGTMADACAQTPQCKGFTVWGTDDAHCWLDGLFPFNELSPNHGLLLDTDLQPKPAYYAVRDAIAKRP
jgi:endo-1,4-beta-xylanase